jgi:hypothetical protein
MKRFIAFILAVLYLSVSVGATIRLHYCMGELVSTTIFGGDSKTCPKCGMEKHSEKSNCCKNINITIQSDKKLLAHQVAQGLEKGLTIAAIQYPNQPEIFLNSNIFSLTTSTHKPPFLSYPIYLHIQNFRI